MILSYQVTHKKSMTISNRLTFSQQNIIILLRGKNMKKFITTNHNVSEIILACLVPVGAGEPIHKNRLSHGIAFNYSGEKIYRFHNGPSFTVKQNDFIYLPKGSNYTVETNIPGETYCINFLLSQNESFDPFIFHIRNENEVIQSYQTAEKAWRRKKYGFQFLCKSELYKILYQLQRNFFTPYTPNSKLSLLAPAITYIHNNYASDEISVEKLSELCSMSYEYFRQLFHIYYNCSPIKYINTLKLNRAKELLSSGLYSVKEAAQQSGFFEMSYFSRFFRKNVGISPLQYINQTNFNN